MNDNIMQVLSLLMKEYGYKIKLSSKSSPLKKILIVLSNFLIIIIFNIELAIVLLKYLVLSVCLENIF